MTVAQQLGVVRASQEQLRQGNTFVHSLRYLMQSKGDGYKAELLAANARAFPEIQTMVKTAVAVGSTGGWGTGLAVVESDVSAFIATLRNFGAFDAAVEYMQRAPIRTRIAVFSGGATSGVTLEGAAKLVSKFTLSGVMISETKVGWIVVVADELLRHAAASVKVIGNELRRGLAVQTDAAFLAKISSGITPSVASGTNASAILADMETALEAMTFASNAKIFAVTTPTIAKAIRTKPSSTGELAFPGALTGDPLGLTTLIASDGVPSGQMILFDATQLAGDAGVVQFDTSNEALVELSDTPTSPPTGTTTLVSLFQNNLAGIRTERIFAVERPLTTSVAIIGSIAY